MKINKGDVIYAEWGSKEIGGPFNRVGYASDFSIDELYGCKVLVLKTQEELQSMIDNNQFLSMKKGR